MSTNQIEWRPENSTSRPSLPPGAVVSVWLRRGTINSPSQWEGYRWDWREGDASNSDIVAYCVHNSALGEKFSTDKPTNPKDQIGSSKLPVHLWPATATAMGSIAFLNGALKYGRSNWRVAGVRASIYKDAVIRHLDAWFEGEETDPDDGVPHLAAALACVAIIVDAKAAGKLNDDRMVEGGYRAIVDELTPHVTRLKELHAGKDPKHHTIQDNERAP